MTDTQRDVAEDGDRLPWLEPDDEYYEEEEGLSLGKLIGAILVALAAIGLIVGGIFWLRNRGNDNDDRIIAAEDGSYKELPTDPGGLKVEGSGSVSYEASQGSDVDGAIDLTEVPEAPVGSPIQSGQAEALAAARELKAVKEAKEAAALRKDDKSGKVVQEAHSVVAPVVSKAREVALPASKAPAAPAPAKAQPVPQSAPAPATGGAQVQLGAFSSDSQAQAAWRSLASRFSYLAPYEHNVTTAQVGGKTYHRLRASAGSEAQNVCAKLKVAGEVCNVVR